MGRASSNKKVSRAASTGGGRTARGRTPVLWYSTIFIAVVIGVMGVYVSASNLRNVAADDTAPQIGKDHWHAAYGIFICDSWAPNLTDKHRDRVGIHSHGDGLIHTHPAVRSAAGKNATFGKFLAEQDAVVTATKISLPKSSGAKRLSVKNGDKCGKKPGKVTAVVFKNQSDNKGTRFSGNPSNWKIANGAIIAVGFVPEGTKLEPPQSVANLADPKDVAPASAPPVSIPPGSTPPGSTPPGSTPPASTPPATAAPPTSPGATTKP